MLIACLDLHAGKDRVGQHCQCISGKDEVKLGSSAAKSREAASKNEMVGANGGVSNRRFPGESRKWDIREQFSGLFVIPFFS